MLRRCSRIQTINTKQSETENINICVCRRYAAPHIIHTDTFTNLSVQQSTKIFHTQINRVSDYFEFILPVSTLSAIYSISPVFLSEVCALAPVVFVSPPSAIPYRDADPPALEPWPRCRPECPDQIPPSDC